MLGGIYAFKLLLWGYNMLMHKHIITIFFMFVKIKDKEIIKSSAFGPLGPEHGLELYSYTRQPRFPLHFMQELYIFIYLLHIYTDYIAY